MRIGQEGSRKMANVAFVPAVATRNRAGLIPPDVVLKWTAVKPAVAAASVVTAPMFFLRERLERSTQGLSLRLDRCCCWRPKDLLRHRRRHMALGRPRSS